MERVTGVKFLGIFLDECLKFGKHVATITCKISRYAPIFYKLRRYLNLDCLKLVYHSLIYSNMTYCISAWGASSKSVTDPLLLAQKKVVRAVFGMPRLAHTAELYQRLNFLTIKNIYTYMVALYVRKAVAFGRSEEFCTRSVTGHSLRSVNPLTLDVPLIRSTHSQMSIKYAGAKIYNELPLCVKSAESYNTFKSNLKKLLLRR